MPAAAIALARTRSIAGRIRLARGTRVILDADLAAIYGTSTRRLNEQVRRNRRRFPRDFAFQLSVRETRMLKSQSATSIRPHGGRRSQPWLFTEHGAVMAASILNSRRAIAASIYVVRAFLAMRSMLNAHQLFTAKLAELECHLQGHDSDIADILEMLHQLSPPPVPPGRPIGFGA